MTMENLGKLKILIDKSNHLVVEVEFICKGKATDKGNMIWNIPAINIWFQTKTDKEAEIVADSLFKHFLNIYIFENNSFDRFNNKLKKLGWSDLPKPQGINLKGFRPGSKKLINPKDYIGLTTTVTKLMNPKIDNLLDIQKSIVSEISAVA